jgi:hypothetical protein
MPTDPIPHVQLLMKVKHALGLSARDLGKVIGVSRRTMTRRWVPSLTLNRDELLELSRAVFPADRDLAAQAATAASTTLEELGLVPRPEPLPSEPSPPTPPPAPVAPPPEPKPLPPDPRLVDSVVCVAADLLSVPPQAVRSVLYAAFRRAREVGLDVAMVEAALAPPSPVRGSKTKPGRA